MKKIVIFLVLLASVLLTSCQKETTTTEHSGSYAIEAQNSSYTSTNNNNPNPALDNPCDNKKRCATEVKDAVKYYLTNADLPGLPPGCTLTGYFDVYYLCGSQFTFTLDFFNTEYTDGDCGLTSDQLDYWNAAAAEIVMKKIIKDWMSNTGARKAEDVEYFKSLCAQICREELPDEVHPTNPDPSNPGGGTVGSGDNTRYRIFRVRCGEGCCKRISTYTLLLNGEIEISDITTTAYGDCITGPVIPWSYRECHWEIIGPCKQDACSN